MVVGFTLFQRMLSGVFPVGIMLGAMFATLVAGFNMAAVGQEGQPAAV